MSFRLMPICHMSQFAIRRARTLVIHSSCDDDDDDDNGDDNDDNSDDDDFIAYLT